MKLETKHGGPAFPIKFTIEDGSTVDGVIAEGSHQHIMTGISVRDYFAAKALAAIIEQNGRAECYAPGPTAAEAYSYADAMLAERAK